MIPPHARSSAPTRRGIQPIRIGPVLVLVAPLRGDFVFLAARIDRTAPQEKADGYVEHRPR